MNLNLGCGHDIREGWVNLDYINAPGVDIVHDLNVTPLPFADNTFDNICADNVLEHLSRYEPVINECHRILIPGGRLEIRVPYGLTGLRSPNHLRLFIPSTMKGYTLSEKEMAVARGLDLPPQFELVKRRVIRHLPFKWHLQHYWGIRTDLGIGRAYEILWVLRKPNVKSGGM